MLVLSRKIDEDIVIGDNIRVSIVDIRGDTVKLGITAPNSVPVHRSEVYQAIVENKNRIYNNHEKRRK
jgi:carbon storage regulator